MINSANLYKDLLIAVIYLTGVIGLTSGEILFSAALLGTATLMSHFQFR